MESTIAPDLIPGYTIVERLGKGGMGTVYKAKQLSLDRWVAIKVLKPDLAKEDPGYVQRFLSEARTAGKLRHENLVAALDCGEVRGLHFMVMEFVEGLSLETVLRDRGVLPEREALSIVLQIAQALQHAWDHRIIHRDIKPQNILIAGNGVAKLCDLGLARLADGGAGLTMTGHVHCTAAYASPEQARGKKDLDTRTDIYSLGVTLYQLVTGARPFSSDSPGELLIQHATERPVPPSKRNPQISAATNQLILGMMEKERERRPETPGHVASAIEGILKSGSRSAPGVPRRPRDRRGATSRGTRIGWFIGFGIAAAMTVGLVVFLFPRASPSPATADRRSEPPSDRRGTRVMEPVEEKTRNPVATTDDPAKRERQFLDRLAHAERQLEKKDWAAARAAVQEALQFLPGDSRAEELRARIDSAELDDRVESAMARAETMAKARNWSEAFEAVEEALRAKPGHSRALELKNSIESRRRDALYSDALARAESHRSKKEWAAALDAVDEALKAKPDDLRAAELRQAILTASLDERFAAALAQAEKSAKESDWSGALAALQEALRLKPEDPKALALRKQIEGSQRDQLCREALALGEKHLKAKEFRRAIAAFEGALALRPGDSRAKDGVQRTKEAGAKDPSLFEELRTVQAHTSWVMSVDVHPKEPLLLSAGVDNVIKLWDAARLKELRTLTGHTSGTQMALFSPDGKSVVSCAKDGTVRFWEVATGKEYHRLKWNLSADQPVEVWELAVSPDGKTLAACGRWSEIIHWDTRTQKFLPDLGKHADSVSTVGFAPQGKYLLSGDLTGTLKMWDLAGCVALQSLQAHQGQVAFLTFRPDGKVLATGGADKLIRLWGMPDLKLLQTLRGHADYVRCLAFTPDGKYLLSGSADKTIRVWDPANGEEIAQLLGHTGQINSLAFSPEGRILVTGGRDQSLRVWGVKK